MQPFSVKALGGFYIYLTQIDFSFTDFLFAEGEVTAT
jgi:hypothetical protein